MKSMKSAREGLIRTGRRHGALVAMVLVVFLVATTLVVIAATPLGVAGYLDHSYTGPPDNEISEPTGKGAESKLWWHDGYWWGVLFSPAEEAFTIHQLDLAIHEWVDTGTIVDTRIDGRAARSDVLWDEREGKLYIATHRKIENPSVVSNSYNWARLLVYSYNNATSTWTVDPGFGDPADPDDLSKVTINRDITESLVLDKDTTGRLWATYVSRPQGSDIYSVFVNASLPNDPTSWGGAFVLPFAEAEDVDVDDISALAAFMGPGIGKVAVMWSNQTDGNFYIAVRSDSTVLPQQGWVLETGLTELFDVPADDHIKLAKAPSNILLATVKTEATETGEPLIAVVKRAANGNYSLHPVALVSTQDTRPTMVVDAASGQAHVFSVSKIGGGNVCIQSAPLSTLDFGETYNCPPPEDVLAILATTAVEAEVVIGDDTTYLNINDPTTTKQMLTEEMDIAVLASDDVNGQVYVHAVISRTIPPPPPRIFANVVDDSIRFEFAPAGANVTFSIYDGPGGDLLWEESRTADEDGFTAVSIWEHRVDLGAGLFVVVSDGTSTKELTIEPISLDLVAPEENVLIGTAAPGRTVWAVAHDDEDFCGAFAVADTSGDWVVDFDDFGCDITAGMWAYAQLFDAEDDTSEAILDFIDGAHTYEQGDVPADACVAGGWAVDTDDRERDLQIRVLADGATVASGIAGIPDTDLVGICGADGSCAFEINLFGRITVDEEHAISVQAFDEETGQWFALAETPQLLTCAPANSYLPIVFR
jgi:hypothetical protein